MAQFLAENKLNPLITPSNSEFAQIEALPADQAGKILAARRVERVSAMYKVVFPLAIVTAAGLVIGAAIFHRQGIDEEGQMKSTLALVCGLIGILVFVIVAVIRLAIGTRNDWLKRVARDEINRRSTKIVAPQNPDARFVEIVPRSNWSDATMPENAIDVGFLLSDLKAGYLLYEGDNERYRIPARAIVGCQQDTYTRLVPFGQQEGHQTVTYHLVVVTIKVSNDLKIELPFRIRGNISLYSDQKVREANYAFFQEVSRLRQTSIEDDGQNQRS